MDMRALQLRLGASADREPVRKAEELLRRCKLQFNAAAFGIGDLCRSVICYELACGMLQMPFDRQKGVKMGGLSEKAYSRSLALVQNALGIRSALDVRELAVQFGCVRLVQSVHTTISKYKERFVASLPQGRRRSADFGRPVFTVVAFFLCAKKHKLKVDKAKLMELTSTSDPEFSNVAVSMNELCFDLVGAEKEKKDPKLNRDLLDNLPSKRLQGDEARSDDEVEASVKRCRDYELWKESVLADKENADVNCAPEPKRRKKQTQLQFQRAV